MVLLVLKAMWSLRTLILTEETVVGWVKAALGEEKVAEVVAALEAQLAEQATPTVGSGTPWS